MDMNRVVLEKKLPGEATLQIVQGDLTEERVDAIVNAANSHLAHGGGVAGAIVRKGGRQIQTESDVWVREHGPVSNAEPAYTSGGSLPCNYVIHAVGPIWGEGDEDVNLAAAVKGSLRRADELKLKSIALPAISTGIFGFPKERAATVILTAVHEYFAETPASGLQQVRLVLYDTTSVDVFVNVWESQNETSD
jgi:O-acetyl-ADP-ribose deacetylase (regulator of RNase III)